MERVRSRRLGVLTAAFAGLIVIAPLSAVQADPQPTQAELQAEVNRMHQQIGVLTEQYNGLRIRLDQAKRAERVAQQTLAQNETRLNSLRQHAAQIASSAYMSNGADPGMAFMTSSSPEAYLSQATALHSIQDQRSVEVTQITQAMNAAARARAGAQQRAADVQRLVTDVESKKAKIQALVTKAESGLYKEALARASHSSSGRRTRLDVPIPGSGKAATATRHAMTQQLKPYVWGAEGPHGYDCSGLVMWAFGKVGISLPHYTGDQWTAGTHINRKQDLRIGDLVFFYSDLHHVGIYIGGGMMIHAPSTGDVVHVAPIDKRPFSGGVRVAD